MVAIDISRMTNGVHEVFLHPSASEIELPEDAFRDIEVRVKLDIGDHQILARITTRTRAELVCDRTLTPFEQVVDGTFAVVFSRRRAPAETEDETIRPLDRHARELDLTEEIRDTILLSVPLRKVAPEADEKVLVLTYGKQSATDPRWDALRQLKSGSG